MGTLHQAGARTKMASNIRAVGHAYKFVACNARTSRRNHLFPADLAVRLVLIVRDISICNFIQSPAMRAFKCFSHPTNIPWLGLAL